MNLTDFFTEFIIIHTKGHSLLLYSCLFGLSLVFGVCVCVWVCVLVAFVCCCNKLYTVCVRYMRVWWYGWLVLSQDKKSNPWTKKVSSFWSNSIVSAHHTGENLNDNWVIASNLGLIIESRSEGFSDNNQKLLLWKFEMLKMPSLHLTVCRCIFVYSVYIHNIRRIPTKQKLTKLTRSTLIY